MEATYKLELNTKPNKDGRYTIFLRETLNRRLKRAKTGIAVKLNQFNKEAEYGSWIVKHPQKKELNQDLDDLIRKARKEGLTIDNEASKSNWTLGTFTEKMVSDASAQSVGYQRNLKSRLGVFVEFAGKELPLTNINLDLLNRFKRELQSQGKMSGTLHTYFNRIKRMTGEALKLELITKDPFLHFDMPGDKPAQRLKLTDKQVELIEAVEVGGKRTDIIGRSYESGIWLFRAKWMYLFAYQMGGIRSRGRHAIALVKYSRRNWERTT